MNHPFDDILKNVINNFLYGENTILCTEKWSEYHTCKGCEDEVNRKGHLTKPQKAVYVEIEKNNFQL